jgi:hypothetical protein
MNAHWKFRLASLGALLLAALALPPSSHAQGALQSGDTVTGSISPAGDVDTWTFSANKGDAFIVRVGEITQVNNFQPYIRVYDPTSTLKGSASGGQAAEVADTAAISGTYTVVVSDVYGTTATGTYRITLAQTGAPVVIAGGDEGGPMTNGTLHTGTIDLGDLDVWTFSANVGDAIVIRAGETSSGSPLTPYLRLFDPNGKQVDYQSGYSAAEVQVTAGSSGTYMVVMADGNTGWIGSGDYRLTLAKTGSPVTVSSGDEGGPMTNGAMHTGTISVGDLDLWTFTANAGEAIVIRAGETSSGSPLTPYLRLFNPNGTQVDYQSGYSAAEVQVTANATGTYLVVVADGNTGWIGSGDYRLTLAKTGSPVTVSPGDEGGPMTNGATHTGTIDVGDLDLWTFPANAGDAIVIRAGELASGSPLTPYLRLFNPNGTQVDYQSGYSAAEVQVTAGVTGTYLLVVADGSTGWVGAGGYRLTLAKTGSPITISSGDEGGPLVNGAMETGTIDVGDLDAWTLTANHGDAIVVRMGETTPGSSLTPYLRIFDPAGVQVSYQSGASAAEVEVNADSTGTFLVVACDGATGWVGSGGYRLTLAKTGSPVAVSSGDEGGPLASGARYTGTISVGDLDVWTLAANPGDAIVVRAGEITAGSALTPFVRVYSPTGVRLGNNSAAAAADVEVNATVAGTYLVVVADGTTGWGGSGDYIINMAHTGEPVTISGGDEGGALPAGVSHGVIDTGDLDLWTVTATAGSSIIVTMAEAEKGASLSPYLRLYSPSGARLDYSVSSIYGQVSVTAPVTGTYLIVATDGSSGWGGTGPYWITPSAAAGVDDAPAVHRFALAPAGPNPFTSTTTLRYGLAADGPAKLALYDAQGRLVRVLLDQPAAAGEHVATWDGRDAAGQASSPGFYWARFEANGRRAVQKLLLAR